MPLKTSYANQPTRRPPQLCGGGLCLPHHIAQMGKLRPRERTLRSPNWEGVDL